jgi:hypothetical protein
MSNFLRFVTNPVRKLPLGVNIVPMPQSDSRYAQRNPYSYIIIKSGVDIGYVTKNYNQGRPFWYFDNASGSHGEVGTQSAAVSALIELASRP